MTLNIITTAGEYQEQLPDGISFKEYCSDIAQNGYFPSSRPTCWMSPGCVQQIILVQ